SCRETTPLCSSPARRKRSSPEGPVSSRSRRSVPHFLRFLRCCDRDMSYNFLKRSIPAGIEVARLAVGICVSSIVVFEREGEGRDERPRSGGAGRAPRRRHLRG